MTTAIILIALACAIVLGWLWYEFDHSPQGWEDEAGFHIGERGDK